MRTSERHHLKDNELALALGQANEWATTNQRTPGADRRRHRGRRAWPSAASSTWRNSVDGKARALLAEAMVVQEARVMPPRRRRPVRRQRHAGAGAGRSRPAPIRPRRPSSKRRCRSSSPPPTRIRQPTPGRTARYQAAADAGRSRPFRRSRSRSTTASSPTARGCCRRWRGSARPKRSCARAQVRRRDRQLQGALRAHRPQRAQGSDAPGAGARVPARRQDRRRDARRSIRSSSSTPIRRSHRKPDRSSRRSRAELETGDADRRA